MDPLAPYIQMIFNAALVAVTVWCVSQGLRKFERSQKINCPPDCPFQECLRNMKATEKKKDK